MRRVSTPTHDHQVKLGLASLGATAERAGPRSLPQTGDSETDGWARAAGRPGARGRSLLFGKALWPALQTDLGWHGSGKEPVHGVG